MRFKIDECKYCACITYFNSSRIVDVLDEIEMGELGCWNCEESNSDHTDFNVYVDDINGKWKIIYEGNKIPKQDAISMKNEQGTENE